MDKYEKILEIGRRRGFIFPSFEIYGGVSGFFNYGPLGSKLKRNIEKKWRDLFVRKEGMVEIESTILMPKAVFEASGHLSHFTDITTKCINCGRNYRVDTLLEGHNKKTFDGMRIGDLEKLIKENSLKCPGCGGKFSKAEPFNLMFQVDIGPLGNRVTGYARPEAGQGQFVDFKRVYLTERERLPLGIAQIGRCFRNEIAPRKGPLRQREFTIIDYEVFIDPENSSYPKIELFKAKKLRLLPSNQQIIGNGEVIEVTVGEALRKGLILNETLAYFMVLAVIYVEELGVPFEKQRFREQLTDEKAHYSKQTFDQEVWLERWGWTEISGHAYRTDYDLRGHMSNSGVDLRVFKAFDKPRRVITTRIEPLVDVIKVDFGEQTDRILELISKSDPVIIERELKSKGYYELPGSYPTRITEKHVLIKKHEEESSGRYFIPHVVEPSFGVDRIFYSVLEYAYIEKKNRTLLQLPRDIAPINVFVFPLVSKDGLPEKAKTIHGLLIEEGFFVEYDETGSIGRRYARADEIGVPLCCTIDYKTLEDKTVTLRDIKTWKQVRTKIKNLSNLLKKYIEKRIDFDQLGTRLN
jgi:glycyl-tRNA synthetase